MAVRQPTHAGSWYADDADLLHEQLAGWLSDAQRRPGGAARAIIAPHAGYSYSGRCAAFAYTQVDPTVSRRVFLLGPSHHQYLKQQCALSRASHYATPLGDIPLDGPAYAQLAATCAFGQMSLEVDEAEHSLEMHLPYLQAAFGDVPFTLVPILVGSLSPESEARYGSILAPYLDDPANLFVISSDFCHWGKRFNYTRVEVTLAHAAAGGPSGAGPAGRTGGADNRASGPADGANGGPPPIFACIEALDRRGMSLIEQQDPQAFTAYLREYENTICGRHPIGVLLNMLQHCSVRLSVAFTRYEQSSQARTHTDSSVSYASAVCCVAPAGG